MPVMRFDDTDIAFEFDQSVGGRNLLEGFREIAADLSAESSDARVEPDQLADRLQGIGVKIAPDALMEIGRSKAVRKIFGDEGAFLPDGPDDGPSSGPVEKPDSPVSGDPRLMNIYWYAAGVGALIGLGIALLGRD